MMVDLYLRLSDGRSENGSFADREKALRAKASALGWTVHRVVVENDLMNGSKSASAFKRRKIGVDANGKPVMRVWRPGFRSILDDLASGRVQAILAEDLDRTMRDPRDAEDLIDIMRERKAWADSLSSSLKFTAGGTDSEVMMARIAVTVAAKSSADTARRVTEGRARQAASGLWGGGRRPYGFDPVADPSGNHRNTRLKVNEAEAAEIRRAADQLLAGVPLKAIARDMISRDVRTVTGTRWTAESLRDTLLKSTNAGIVPYDGQETATRLPGDPILHEDTWRAVTAKLRDPARRTQTGRAPTWLGTNLYRCVCGSVMEIQAGRDRARSYRCAREGGSGDVHVRRNTEQLDAFVTAVIVERLSRPDTRDLSTPAKSKVDVKALRRKVIEQQEILGELARDRAENLITREQMLTATKTGKAKLEALQQQLASVTDRSPLEAIAGAADVNGTWERLSLGQQRAILAELIVVTVLPSSRKGRGFDPGTVKIEAAAA